jgi:hypothetical protein
MPCSGGDTPRLGESPLVKEHSAAEIILSQRPIPRERPNA